MTTIEPMSFDGITTVSLKERQSKVSLDLVGKRYQRGAAVAAFLDGLPRILGGQDVRDIVDAVVAARKNGRPVILGMGAHVIKVGLSPLIIQLMEENVINGVALNGAGAIHDVELSLEGRTSEDVEQELDRGSFGMSADTATFINHGVVEGVRSGNGVGASLGLKLLREKVPHLSYSILGRAAQLEVPVMVHVAFGTDIVHIHPSFDAAAWGTATYQDFRQFCSLVAMLEGGVFLNVGSAVIIPEVFLKALTVVRNKGHQVDHFTTVNMDFIRHYRPLTNVVSRPVRKGGKGYNLVGQHEIMVPLLCAGILERL
ncbi:MAG TPA: hypothetical protein PLG17_04635 [Thermodesulfobacteriota bacterium]|nr:hypothetical protein [Deltaproteobacteria bacterium]HNR13244.1 hypothetical protein [Thermodesulfobacteriota bacterium]HNU70613.1 hypothetical protein [Thermodesulfobacteriota bacterium]HOC38089.1 hypothetical protein [Thermodesulfobacteriota bacterium]HQO77781.1 hypothetical protein [Thermodesulfobacteriota bacterium]